jgi:DNA-binding transcriptional regulator YhcF (GntR family)
MLEDQGVILTAGRKGTFVRYEAAHEVAKVKTSRAERLMRRLIKMLLLEGMSRREISDIFTNALSVEARKG